MFLICGEALYDLFLAGEASAGSLRFDARPGGSPFNVAVGMARLGAPSALFTGLSDDMLGTCLATLLRREGVDTQFLVRTGRRTTLSIVGVDETGGPSYAFYGVGSADCSLEPADLPVLGDEITGLHFGSYSIAVSPVADALADLAAREAHRFISLDPNVRPTVEPDIGLWRRRIDTLRGLANLVKVSDEDMEALYPGEDPVSVIRSWASDRQSLVVLTRGASQCVAIRGSDEIRLTPPPVDVVDTVGAGDSFQAALLSRLSLEADPAAFLAQSSLDDITQLLRRAADAAAITCARPGADLPSTADLQKMTSA